jgi:hypothetical protein
MIRTSAAKAGVGGERDGTAKEPSLSESKGALPVRGGRESIRRR